ncbi:hypothetical protein HDU96_000570 [Phlyctochytrium bullatum]|nr:hypothetical protein HDU96_000570 [Phlyctochytrium bullatum]
MSLQSIRLPVVGLWLLPFLGLQTQLMWKVIKLRQKFKIPINDGMNEVIRAEVKGEKTPEELKQMRENSLQIGYAIRAHANFTENVPIALLTLAIAELNGMPQILLHGLLGFFFYARWVHGATVQNHKKYGVGSGRVTGVMGTSVVTVAAAAWSAVAWVRTMVGL